MSYKIAGFGVCGKGEADRYLEATLKEFKRLCDVTYIVCNNAGKKEKDLIKHYGFNIIEDNREWGLNQWRIKEDAVKGIQADWFIVLDMDEVFDSSFTRKEAEKLCAKGGTGYYFYITNLYDNGYSRKWSFWNIRLFNGSYSRDWERKPLHCGLAPRRAYEWGNYAPFLLKHYGLKEKADRDKKVKRYEQYDPQAKFKSKAYYDFLSSKEKVNDFDENKLHDEVASEVKNYKHKIPKIMENKIKKFFFVKNPKGQILDIEESYLSETLDRDGFELVSKEPVVKGGSGVETTVVVNDKIDVEPVEEVAEEKESDNKLECSECGFIAKSKVGLSAHTRKHNAGK